MNDIDDAGGHGTHDPLEQRIADGLHHRAAGHVPAPRGLADVHRRVARRRRRIVTAAAAAVVAPLVGIVGVALATRDDGSPAAEDVNHQTATTAGAATTAAAAESTAPASTAAAWETTMYLSTTTYPWPTTTFPDGDYTTTTTTTAPGFWRCIGRIDEEPSPSGTDPYDYFWSCEYFVSPDIDSMPYVTEPPTTDTVPFVTASPTTSPDDALPGGPSPTIPFPGTTPPPTPPPTSCPVYEYVIVIGDSPASVAARFDLSVEQLAVANAGDPDYDAFVPRTVIHIPFVDGYC